jgi:hypothetical protein
MMPMHKIIHVDVRLLGVTVSNLPPSSDRAPSDAASELPLFSGSEAIPLEPDAALGVAARGPY